MEFYKPHYDKLLALIANEKMAEGDKPLVEKAIEDYNAWIEKLLSVEGTEAEIVLDAVRLLNDYRNRLDIDLIFDNENDFLYRQKGQLKLDNSVIEEFIPILVWKIFGERLGKVVALGPNNCFLSLYFKAPLVTEHPGGGVVAKTKNQDFAICKPVFIKTSHTSDFEEYEEISTNIGYIVTEIKTNLDKTMFQEAAATARDVKTAVEGAKYYLLCEWLDMRPINVISTAIDEVLILRKAKRTPSNLRANFNTSAGRIRYREEYVSYLLKNRFSAEVFSRFINHIKPFFETEALSEKDALKKGYF